jgi:hypothetical protein
VIAAIVALLLALSIGVSAASVDCGNRLVDLNGYRVLDVDLTDPLGFIAPWTSPFSSLKPALAIKQGQPFQLAALNKDVVFLRTVLTARDVTSTLVFKVAYVSPRVTCDDEAKTVRVSYLMLTNVVSAHVAPSIEDAIDEDERPATTGAVRATTASTSVVPLAGYNATRGTFGGLSLGNTIQGVRVDGQTIGSADSLTARLEVAGTIPRASAHWRGGQLSGAFEYFDTPAGASHAREDKIAIRFSQSTEELSQQRIVFRYGGALEGGRQRNDDASIVQNSGYGSVKLYAGVTGRRGQSAFSSSYGFQAGATFADGVPAFTKHLIDVGYATRIAGTAIGDGTGPFRGPLSVSVHRSLDLQLRFSAGVIRRFEGAPLAERFLGGNELRPFVPDDEWTIPSDAFIRSIPENALGTAGGFEGGDRFYAANVTAAWPLWGRPLVPRELARDPTFLTQLNGSFSTIVGTLADNYKTNDPAYARQAAEIPEHARAIRAALDATTAAVMQIPLPIAARPPVAKAIKDVQADIRMAKGGIALIEQGDVTVAPVLVNHYVPTLAAHAEVLRRTLDAAEVAAVSSDIAVALARADAPSAAIKGALDAIDSDKYRRQAAVTLAPAHNALDIFLHQLNAYSIAPVAIFDAAQISPAAAGTRYGIGGGVRFSLINVNVSAAYVFNIHPIVQEGRGAVFVKLDVTNVFP